MTIDPRTSAVTLSPIAVIKRLAIGVLLINLFIIVLVVQMLNQSYRGRLERAAVTAQSLAQVLAENIASDISRCNMALLAVSDEVKDHFAAGGIDGRTINEFMARQKARLPDIDSLRMTDTQGTVTYGSGLVAISKMDLSDRDFFIRARDDTGADLLIAQPVLERISKKWVLPLARRLNRPNGAFAGVVYANIALDRLAGKFADIDVGKLGAIVLFDSELAVVVRYPEPEGSGRSVGNKSISAQLQGQFQAGRDAATYDAASSIDGIERTFSYRKVSGYPLYVSVGLAKNDYLARWRREAVETAVLAALFALITLLSALLISRSWKNRMLASDALRESEERLNLALAGSKMGVWEWDMRTDAIYWSPECHEIIGGKDFGGRLESFTNVLHPEDAERVMAAANRAVSEKTAYEAEFRIIRPGGEVRWVANLGRAKYDRGGRPLRLVCTVRDITERKRMEMALEESEERFKTIYDEATDGILLADVETKKFHTGNQMICKMLGYGLEEISTLGVMDIHPEKNFAYVLQQFENQAEKKYSLARDIPVKRKDNTVFYADINSVPIRLTGRKYLLGIFRDITERKRTEDALRESEQKYRALIETTNTGYVILDTTGKVLDANLEYLKLTGRTALEDVVGRNVVEWTSEEDRERNAREVKKCLEQGFVRNLEINYIGRDGTTVPIEVNATVIKDAGSSTILALCRDVNERKMMETEMLKAQKLESVGILAGGIAHDFNNLLQSIIGNISLAKMYAIPGDKLFARLERTEKAAESAAELSFRLLTFATGGEPVRTTAHIQRLIRDTLGLSLSGSNIAGEIDLPEDLYSADIDQGQIKQVFNNLFINAKEAMPKGGTIKVRGSNIAVRDEDDLPLQKGKYLKISVEDSGMGIPKKNLPIIFDPYFSTKGLGSNKGTGLGLSVCHSIIKRHGGHIGVESREGMGTIFHVYLPASGKVLGEEIKEEADGHGVFRGMLLLMDDDERLLTVVKEMMNYLGYKVDTVKNGEEAIERYSMAKEEGTGYDAVVLDLTVQGGMGGEEALEKLFEIDQNVKAIISSGYADDPVMKNFKTYGFVDAIAKPYTIEKLTKLLAKL